VADKLPGSVHIPGGTIVAYEVPYGVPSAFAQGTFSGEVPETFLNMFLWPVIR
jgi:hypothetical protein